MSLVDFMDARKRMLAAFLAVCLFLFSFVFLSGCASSSKYVPCCKRDGIYDTAAVPEAILGSPVCTLADGNRYGACDAASVSDGTVKCMPDAAQCNKPVTECTKTIGCVWDGGASACRVTRCGDFADNESCLSALCSWSAVSGTCTGANAYVAMPICVDANPKSCVNDKCSVMLCGYEKYAPAPPIASSDWTQANQKGTQPAPASTSDAINLLGTSCVFKKMNDKTYNAVANSRGALWANAFRFGVGSSFLQFEQARFFFPLSDRFCTGVVTPNLRDRFVVYNNASATWCAQVAGFFECTENGLNFTDADSCEGYCKDSNNCVWRQNQPPHYSCRESGMVYGGESQCKDGCGIVENPKACPLDRMDYPFLEADNGYKMDPSGGWKLDYSGYETALGQQYGVGGNTLKDYECESGADCMSGFCDTTYHSRGLCVDATDPTGVSRIDCGCQARKTENGMALNCSDAFYDSGTQYYILRSVIKNNLNCVQTHDSPGRSTGTVFSDGTFWPWSNGGYSPGDIGDKQCAQKSNEVEQITDGIMFSQGSGGNLGNVGSLEKQTYRFYVRTTDVNGNSVSEPPKIFENCEIPVTAKPQLYSAYGHTAPEGDKAGSREMSQVLFHYRHEKGGCCDWGYSNSWMDGLVPGGADVDEDSGSFGTGSAQSLYCTICSNRNDHYSGEVVRTDSYWVYELSFDGNSDRVGKCKLINNGKQVPFIDAKSIGWCEGCTYSTLASQTVTDADYSGKATAKKIDERMPLYMQANVMPVLDVGAMGLSEHYEDNMVCNLYKRKCKWTDCSGLFNLNCHWRCRPVCAGWVNEPLQWTEYNGVSLCNNNKGAALYVVSDLSPASGIADRAIPSSGSNKGVANAVNVSADKETEFVSYLGAANAALDDNGHTLYLNGYAAAIWKAQMLKNSCENQPLTAILLNGYSNWETTNDVARMNSLIGNAAEPGILYRFFFNKTMPAFGETPLPLRVQNAQPDHYPDSIDLLAQEWYPTCNVPRIARQVGGGEPEPINATKFEFESRLAFSRSLLSNFSKPSIITKFHFPEGSRCNQQEFMEYVFKHKGDMVDAGIMGLIYDNWDTAGVEGGQFLENPETGSRENTPFCAVQNGSKLVMGLSTLTYGQKIIAENRSCACQPCDATAYSMGICDVQLVQTLESKGAYGASDVPYLTCNDGHPCQMPVDPNTGNEFTNYSRYFCPSLCADSSKCDSCANMAGASLSCRIETVYADYKTTKSYSDLNDNYWNLLSALPAEDKCCLQKDSGGETITYTYMKKQSVTQRSEMLQYPRKGEVGIDCGRAPDTSFLSYCGIEIPINDEATTCFRVG